MLPKSSTPELIAEYTEQLFSKYDRLKAGDKSIPFWDLVIICCSADRDAEAAFGRCLSTLVLPPGTSYRVMPDPPGPHVECGGASMHVLKILTEEFTEKLADMKIMMIHAGGFSKRLVQHAVLGKLCSPLPVGDRGVSMLELKLVMYMPYVPLLPAGVFVTGCDDIQLVWLPDPPPGDLFPEVPSGFVALAHPAPVSVAVNHGVYVLPPRSRSNNQGCHISPCEEVLQKPSAQLMRDRGAVYIEDGVEMVHIDGTFWMGSDAVQRLLQLWDHLQPLQEELSAYRDFLPCLGRRPDSHYQAVVAAMDAKTPRAVTNSYLRQLDLKVLVLPQSRFFHIGTVPEYVTHLVEGSALSRALRFRRRCHAVVRAPTSGVVIHARLSADTALPERSLVEYSRLEGHVSIGEGTVVSHVHVKGTVQIPAGILLHTAAVKRDGVTRHVTIALGVKDDVKSGVTLLGSDIVCDKCESKSLSVLSLWSARIFPSADSMAESASKTLEMLSLAPPYVCSDQLWSMKDVVEHRDPMTMLDFRERLCKDIDD